tara:strand:+ start:113 stop:607 length:495 start_codon:yes stop_codon:yes gene_type:complete
MNITTEFLTTIGELSSLILELSQTEEALKKTIKEFEAQIIQTQTSRAEMESTMIDLIAKHGTAHLLKSVPYFSQLPRVDLDPNPGKLVTGLSRRQGYEINIIQPGDDREFLRMEGAIRYAGVRRQVIEHKYKTGRLQIYVVSQSDRAYRFATEDLDKINPRSTR